MTTQAWREYIDSPEFERDFPLVTSRVLHCPKCGQEHRVADNVTAAYCDTDHMTAAYHEGLPAEDGRIYAIGWPAWMNSAIEIIRRCLGIAAASKISFAKFVAHWKKKRSPADAVWLEYGVHL